MPQIKPRPGAVPKKVEILKANPIEKQPDIPLFSSYNSSCKMKQVEDSGHQQGVGEHGKGN